MAGYIFDCETNGLLPELTTIHSLVMKDIDTGEVFSYSGDIPAGIERLAEADLIVGHNVIKFDIPALQKVYSHFKPTAVVRDTLLLTRLIWPEIKDRDFRQADKGKFPKNLIGAYSLEAWGHRLGNYKGDFKGPWNEWTQEMQEYCEQDVEVTRTLWGRIVEKNYSLEAVELEHEFAKIIFAMEQHGYPFNRNAAVKLYAELGQRRLDLESKLKETFKPWYVAEGKFTPKRDNKKNGYTAGVEFTKVHLEEFSPNSRDQIAKRLTKQFGWKPKEFTDGGKPQIDDDILNELPFPETKLLAEYFMVEKRIGALAEGKNAWLKLEQGGLIHGSVQTVGAVTRRCTHSRPNVSQVPSLKNSDGPVPYGKECRELFYAPNGLVQIGADASGLELRCLAHYMAKYDNGAYGKLLLEGDVHTANAEAAGLPTRDQAKRFIYAFLYGAGDAKIGSIIGKGASHGKKLKVSFLAKTPALKRLKEDISAAVKKRGYLKAIDGGIVQIRSDHAALNTLLQSAGAIVVKLATVIWYREMLTRGYVWGSDFALVAHIHDELQIHAKENKANEVGQIAVESIRKAGEQLGFRCPLDGAFKIGRNWAETH